MSFHFDKSKRLWLLVFFALIIAITLILISFIRIYFKRSFKKENNIYDIKGYDAEYNVTVVSNKTNNTYIMHEIYTENYEKKYFKFEFINNLDEKFTYIFKDNSVEMSSNKQINIFEIKEYDFFSENLISLSTFLELYKNIELKKDNDYKIEKNKVNDTTVLIISALDNITKDSGIFRKNLNVSKLELILNKDNNPIEYYVLDKDDSMILGIKYTKFNVLEKFDEKIFANFNK